MRWYRCWMRMICLLNSGDSKWEERAEQTLDRCTLALIQSPEAHSLVHWLASLLLASPSPIVIPALASVLIESEPPQLLHYKIIARFRRDLQSPQRAGPVLAYYMNMPAEESAALQLETIKTLQKLVSNVEFSSQAIKVASVLALNNDQATDVSSQCCLIFIDLIFIDFAISTVQHQHSTGVGKSCYYCQCSLCEIIRSRRSQHNLFYRVNSFKTSR